MNTAARVIIVDRERREPLALAYVAETDREEGGDPQGLWLHHA
jgi:hypothetical protein